MTKTVLGLTIALAVTGCTIYIGGDDEDHGGPAPDAGWWPEGDAGWWPEGDAGWPEGDAGWYPDGGHDTDATPIGDAGVPDGDASCGTP
jgi:hypothetical protein